MSTNDSAVRELAREFASLDASLVAAVYLDARCDFDAARQMLRFVLQQPEAAASAPASPAPAKPPAAATPSAPSARITMKVAGESKAQGSRAWWPPALPPPKPPPPAPGDAEGFVEELFGALDRQLVRAVLAAHAGNVTAAVDALLLECAALPPPPSPPQPQHQHQPDPQLAAAAAAPAEAAYDGEVAALCDMFPAVSPDEARAELAANQHDVSATIAALLARPELQPADEPDAETLERIAAEADVVEARKADVRARTARVLAAGGRTWGGAALGGWASKRPPGLQYQPAASPAPAAPQLPAAATSPVSAAAVSPTAAVLKDDMASQLKVRELRERFSWADVELVTDVLALHRYQLPAAAAALDALFPAFLSASKPVQLKPPKPSPAAAPQSNPEPVSVQEPAVPKPAANSRGSGGGFKKVKKGKKKGSATASPDSGRELRAADVCSLGPEEARRLADQCAARRTQCYRLASAAYGAGDGARAQHYAGEGRHSSELLQALHVRLASCAVRGDVATADLHGLHVGEALEVVRSLLSYFAVAHPGQPRPPRTLSLVTGAGRHSAGGVARIRPALIDFFHEQQLSFSQPSDAVLLVQLRR